MTEILVVDDDDALRVWAERVVRERGYSCDAAGDAACARELLAKYSYEIVLLDVNMPGESGIELLSHIRADHPDTAVMMVTGEDDMRLATSAIELGAFGYAVKPVGAGELLINVANALHRRALELESRRLMHSLKIAYTHHERWDGNGYPRALRGEEIPVEGRIAALADVFDALTSDRVYRPAFPLKTAVEMMRSERATHFDPEMLDVFLDTLDELEGIRHTYAD